MNNRHVPRITGELRAHILEMPDEIYQASGMVVLGKRLKSVVFSTDIAIIRNCNADAVLAVYPFTPQQAISHPIISASYIPVFCGVGGGTTTGKRTVTLAKDAEAQGAIGVVVNAPLPNETVRLIADVVDIPIVATVLNENTDIEARLEAGVDILNISAAERTPQGSVPSVPVTPPCPSSPPAAPLGKASCAPSTQAPTPSAIPRPAPRSFLLP